MKLTLEQRFIAFYNLYLWGKVPLKDIPFDVETVMQMVNTSKSSLTTLDFAVYELVQAFYEEDKEKVIDFLLQGWEKGNDFLKARILALIIKYPEEKVTQKLIDIFRDPEGYPIQRVMACRALRKRMNEDILDIFLETAYLTNDKELRKEIFSVLGTYKDDKVTNALIIGLKESRFEIAELSCKALGKKCDEEGALEALIRACGDKRPEITRIALTVLNENEKILPLIKAVLGDDENPD